MPTIKIRRKQKFITDDMLRLLTQAIRDETARALHSAGVPTGIDQIEVRVEEAHPLDLNTCDLDIEIVPGRTHIAVHMGTLRELATAIRHIIPATVGEPPRPVDTWIAFDLGERRGRRIWPMED